MPRNVWLLALRPRSRHQKLTATKNMLTTTMAPRLWLVIQTLTQTRASTMLTAQALVTNPLTITPLPTIQSVHRPRSPIRIKRCIRKQLANGVARDLPSTYGGYTASILSLRATPRDRQLLLPSQAAAALPPATIQARALQHQDLRRRYARPLKRTGPARQYRF